MDDRIQHRLRALKTARIVYNLGRASLDVQIKNLSSTGAKLRLGVLWPCPSVFDLEVPNPNTGIPTRLKCERIWQKGYDIGVRYQPAGTGT